MITFLLILYFGTICALSPIDNIRFKRSIGSRIIGGEEARAGQFPWQAAIYVENSSGRYFCGGALVSSAWVLTAGHCVYDMEEFTVHLGSNSLASTDANRLTVVTSTYIVHPSFNPSTLEHDVGLIKFRLPIEYTEYVQKISIANQGQIFDGIPVTASGWGQISDTSAGLNNNLHYVGLTIIDNAQCQLIYGTQIKSGMVCAAGNYNEGICVISSLVEQHGNSGALRPSAVARVGQAVNLAVERFVTVGEAIADDYPEVRQGMYEACKEARQAGGAIEQICEEHEEEILPDRSTLVRAARCLLGAITRVLLLADIVVVKQLLLAKDKVSHSLDRLESVNNFTEFVKAFSQFGAEMVELAHLTGDRQNDLKDERRRAQMAAARQVLERSTMMLLTSSKTCLRHPDSSSSRENRDTVFCQMRRAMDLIHFVVKDGVLNSGDSSCQTTHGEELENDRGSAYACMRHLQHLLELTKVAMDNSCQETLPSALEAVLERTQDFTDSAYTSHEHREAIIESSERLKAEVDHLLGLYANIIDFEGAVNCPEVENAVSACINSARDLSRHLSNAGVQQAQELNTATKQGLELVSSIRQQALSSDVDRLHHTSNAFQDSIDHILEVCKLLRHVAVSETLQVSAKFTEINLRVYGPQVITAAKTLAAYPSSKIAQENLEVFADMYQWLVSDVTTIVKDVLDASQAKPEKQVYMSLPRPGKHGTTSKPLKAVRLDTEEQEKIAKSGLEMKLITSEMDAETEKWQESNTQVEENNDIVKRAKNMSAMAFSMYQFTKGEGVLKTTQDLFTQAEYFAEEANRLYKVIRQFSYQVPGGANKKELLENLDKVPTFVQRLQFTVKDHTVGKAATFTKVDNVIQETKNLMNVISKVVTTCFECATKYKLEFRGSGVGPGRGAGGEGGSSSGGGGGGDNKGVGATGQDQNL